MRIDWIHLLFAFDGRIGRRSFWLGLSAIVIFELAVMLSAASALPPYVPQGATPVWFRNLSLLVDILVAWPTMAVLVKRHHDRGQEGIPGYWLVALTLAYSTLDAFGLAESFDGFTVFAWIVGVPLMAISVALIVELGFRPGMAGANAWGPAPADRTP